MDEKFHEGDQAFDFCLFNGNNEKVCLESYKGKWVVLYFYPKDNTPGCTTEAIGFSNSIREFEELNAIVLGISPDSTESHDKFCDKHGLKVQLLSDTNHEIVEKYGVWQIKHMYGKEYYGVVRSTFLIDPNGFVRHIWSPVNVKNHVSEVKDKLIELQNEK